MRQWRDGLALLLAITTITSVITIQDALATDLSDVEKQAQDYLDSYRKRIVVYYRNYSEALWEYELQLDHPDKKQIALKATEDLAATQKEGWKLWFGNSSVDWQDFTNVDLKRSFQLLSVLGEAALDTADLEQLNQIIAHMVTVYSNATTCFPDEKTCNKTLTDLENEMATSRNYEDLMSIWEDWRTATGKQIRSNFTEYVTLTNKAAKNNNNNDLKDASDMWLWRYNDTDFANKLAQEWEKVKPLYERLHAYVRCKLRKVYSEIKGQRPPLPAHVLGNMWAQDWQNLYDIVVPYSGDSYSVNITFDTSVWNVQDFFNTANKFFKDLSFPFLEPVNLTLKLSPKKGEEMVCHASAWDMFTDSEYRIKMCGGVSLEDFITAHHEMGHVEYYSQYKSQPIPFREGANPGFHEAIGDTIVLSVLHPDYLKDLKLLPENFQSSQESELNLLMQKALQKVAFLPFAYVVDLWRWGVFSNSIKESEYNRKWWELSYDYQGIQPDGARGEDNFDPGAKYHVAAGVPYISYFVSTILQFQFHQALCPTKPLHNCTIYNHNDAAGILLKKMMQKGASEPWQDILLNFTGTRELNASVMVEYFAPLEDFLNKAITDCKEPIGWGPDKEQNQTVPIVVGAVLGGMVALVLIAYVIGRRRRNVQQAKETSTSTLVKA